jgi:hypothetical protein
VSSALERDVPLWELLEASTIATLAEIIHSRQVDDGPSLRRSTATGETS